MAKSFLLGSRSLFSLARLAATLVVAATSVARAAPPSTASEGLAISASARCRVALTKVSYDDPGADDAELIELQVTSLQGALPAAAGVHDAGAVATCGSGRPSPGANGGADASGPDGGALDAAAGGGEAPVTLGDCGLRELSLLDGNGGACNVYRTISLADVPLTPDGWVTLCAAGSALDALQGCDVTSAGHAALKAGWLQNGPSDGLRFVGTDGAALLDVGYEGGPACFSASARSLVTETGESAASASGDPTDDVNVYCGDHFELLPATAAPLRAAAACPVVVTSDGGASDATRTLTSAEAGTMDSGWSPERAPSTPSRRKAAATSASYLDAGAPPSSPAASMPKPPGCAVSPGGSAAAPRAGCLAALGVVALSAVIRRRRRRTLPRAALRAGSSARCGSWLRR
jgi:MYXO-CTERM domain-containing protein